MRKVARYKRQQVNNALMTGIGSSTVQDRGASQTLAHYTLNPYFNNNFMSRWQDYTRWYNTSWEARKVVDIPIDDAFRVPPVIKGLDEETTKAIIRERDRLHVVDQLKRALKQERLYGGSVLLPIFNLPLGTDLSTPFSVDDLTPDSLLGFNVIDVTRLSRSVFSQDPFSPAYDHITSLTIQGKEVDESRMLIFDGDPLTSRNSQTLLTNFRYNPCGFGESKLTILYDLLMRAIGTQQGAYHLVNMASVLLVEAENLRSLMATDSPARDKLQEVVEQISIYRGAIVDAKGVKVTQHSASFGSVPELVITFTQLLSAASDIPATRFLGQAPGGLNATGESDTRNYYDMIDSVRNTKIHQGGLEVINWIGGSLYGAAEWVRRSEDLELEYKSLWSLPEYEQMRTNAEFSNMIANLFNSGIISQESAIQELNTRGIFNTKLEPLEAPEQPIIDPAVEESAEGMNKEQEEKE